MNKLYELVLWEAGDRAEMNKLYELVLWDAGDRKPLGYFKTKKEAVEAMRLVKKYYEINNERLQDRLKDGDAGYEIIPHDFGFTVSTWNFIQYYQNKIEPKEGT